MEPHGQNPWFPKDAPQGANIPYQRTNSSTGEPVVLLVRDRRKHYVDHNRKGSEVQSLEKDS